MLYKLPVEIRQLVVDKLVLEVGIFESMRLQVLSSTSQIIIIFHRKAVYS
jgi:hypothetical protein